MYICLHSCAQRAKPQSDSAFLIEIFETSELENEGINQINVFTAAEEWSSGSPMSTLERRRKPESD